MKKKTIKESFITTYFIHDVAYNDLESGKNIEDSEEYAKKYVDKAFNNLDDDDKIDFIKDNFSLKSLPDDIYNVILYDFVNNNEEEIWDFIDSHYTDDYKKQLYDKIGATEKIKEDILKSLIDEVDEAISDYEWEQKYGGDNMKESNEKTMNFKVKELEKLANDVMKKFKDDKTFESFYSHASEYVDGFVSEDALVDQYGYSYDELEDDEGYLNAIDTFILHVWDIMNENGNLNESRKIVKEAKDTKLDDREFFDNFKLKLHKTSFGYYDVYDWIYDMTGIMPHKDEIYGVLKAWEDKGWIKTDKNKFGAEIFRLVLDERLNQNIPVVRNIPMHESRRRNRKMMKESIDIDKEQVIEITPEMKQKYPSLEKYSEIIITGQKMDWWDADRYASNHNALLPDRKEMFDVWSIINDTGEITEGAWTREIYLEDDDSYILNEAWFVSSNVKRKGTGVDASKSYKFYVFCLR